MAFRYIYTVYMYILIQNAESQGFSQNIWRSEF